MVTGTKSRCQLVFTLVLCVNTALQVNAIDHSNDHWPSLNRALNEVNWPVRGHLIHFLHEIINSPDIYSISASCNSSLQYFVDGLEKNREDSFKLLDSWSKAPAGFLSGQYVDFGHWEQCLHTTMQSPPPQATGKYCLYHLTWPLHASIREDLAAVNRHNDSWIKYVIADSDAFRFTKVAGATCLPSTCSRDEIQSIVDKFTSKLQIPLRVEIEKTCDTLNDFNISYLETPIYKQVCGYTLVLLVATTIICTIKSYSKETKGREKDAQSPKGSVKSFDESVSYDTTSPDNKVKAKEHQKTLDIIVRAFDARSNTIKLNEPIEDKERQELTHIHGMRVLYLASCVWAHFVFVSGMTNSETHMGIIHFQGPSNSVLSGLTQMSGLLVSWMVVLGAALAYIGWNPEFEKSKGKISFARYFFVRLLRFWPVMGGTLMLILAYPPSWGSGPVFRKSYEKLTRNCLDSWWMELLFIGNQRKAMESCIVHAWYIASDSQLYAWGFILIRAFYKSRRLGVTFACAGIIIGMAAQALQTWYYNTGMTFAFTVQRIHVSIEETHLLHFATLNYISSYCIGILLGYVISNRIKVSRRVHLVGWSIAFLLAIVTTVWHDFLFKQLEVTRFQVILTASLLRTIMAIIGAWLIYSGWLGIPGLTHFFSRHIFVIFGRINFSTFMIHMLLIWHNDFKLHQPIEYRTFPLISRWITELVCAHVLGYLMYLVIEAPFYNLTKLFMQRAANKLKSNRCNDKCTTSTNGHQRQTDKLKDQ